jgi:hypothetical protein
LDDSRTSCRLIVSNVDSPEGNWVTQILGEEGVNMKKYQFITPDGLSFKPSCDSPAPDFLDIEIMGHGPETSIQDAISDLIELNESARLGNLDRPFTGRYENNRQRRIWVRDYRSKICQAG